MKFANEFIRMLREQLARRGSSERFPEHLLGEITAALNDPARRDDMVLQLMELTCVEPKRKARFAKLIGGRLLYEGRGARLVVWGAQEFVAQEGFSLKPDQGVIVVGDRPCWIERSEETRRERVVWAGRLGTLYPNGSIGELKNCGGVPCYSVNERECDERFGFVVLDEAEGKHYESTFSLAVAGNEPAYTAYDPIGQKEVSGHHAPYVYVCGTDEVFRAQHVTCPCVAGGIAYTKRTLANADSTVEIWKGRERMLEAYRVRGISVVGGQLAYAAQLTKDGPTTVHILGEERVFPDVDSWWTNRHDDNAFVVFDGWDESVGVHVNFTHLCDGCVFGNAISFHPDTGILGVRLDGEREAREFDLRALGVLPAEPSAA